MPRFSTRTLMVVVGAAAVFFTVAVRDLIFAVIFLPLWCLLVFLSYQRLTGPPPPR